MVRRSSQRAGYAMSTSMRSKPASKSSPVTGDAPRPEAGRDGAADGAAEAKAEGAEAGAAGEPAEANREHGEPAKADGEPAKAGAEPEAAAEGGGALPAGKS